MKSDRRAVIQAISALGMLGLANATRAADGTYPSRPIHIIVPYGPGSGTDMVARMFGEAIAKDLKQSVVIDNRPGAGGEVGTGFVGHADPDGYTLLTGAAGPLVTGPYIQNINFDPAKTLVPVAMIAYSPFVLVVPKDSPYKSVKELIEAAKASPGKFTYGSSGIGSSGHLAGALLEKDAGIKMLHVPYPSGSKAVLEVAAGRIDCFFAAFPTASSAIEGKEVRALAMATAERSSLMPDLPTVAEAGYPDFNTGTWVSLMAPTGTPDNVIETLYKSIAEAIKTPKVKAFLVQIGCEPYLMDPKKFGAYLASERARWKALVKEFGLEKK